MCNIVCEFVIKVKNILNFFFFLVISPTTKLNPVLHLLIYRILPNIISNFGGKLTIILTDLLLSGRIVLRCNFVKRPLIPRVIIRPLAEMVPKVKTPSEKKTYRVSIVTYESKLNISKQKGFFSAYSTQALCFQWIYNWSVHFTCNCNCYIQSQ